jgi:hypothetical protein
VILLLRFRAHYRLKSVNLLYTSGDVEMTALNEIKTVVPFYQHRHAKIKKVGQNNSAAENSIDFRLSTVRLISDHATQVIQNNVKNVHVAAVVFFTNRFYTALANSIAKPIKFVSILKPLVRNGSKITQLTP